MRFAGYLKQSFIDFPGKIASVAFVQGCNLRCGFCHNKELVSTLSSNIQVEEGKILEHLYSNKNLIDGIVISGGEPGIHTELFPFMEKCKREGFLVKLDTNGLFSKDFYQKLKENAHLIDAVGLDIKAAPATLLLEHLSGGKFLVSDTERWLRNIDFLQQNIDVIYYRTTVIKEFHDKEAIKKICEILPLNAHYTLQNFNPENCLDPYFESYSSLNEHDFDIIEDVLQEYSVQYTLRK